MTSVPIENTLLLRSDPPTTRHAPLYAVRVLAAVFAVAGVAVGSHHVSGLGSGVSA